MTSCDLSHMHKVLLCLHPTCDLNDKAKAEEIKAQYIGEVSVSTPGGGWDSSEWVHDYHHICSQPISLGKEWVKEERRRGEYKDGSSDDKPKPLEQICKPKGQAGWSDGYQIIDALGLSSRKDTYNMLTVHMLSTLLCFISLCAHYLTGPYMAAGLPASWYQSCTSSSSWQTTCWEGHLKGKKDFPHAYMLICIGPIKVRHPDAVWGQLGGM